MIFSFHLHFRESTIFTKRLIFEIKLISTSYLDHRGCRARLVQIKAALDVSGDKGIKKNEMGKENQGKFLPSLFNC